MSGEFFVATTAAAALAALLVGCIADSTPTSGSGGGYAGPPPSGSTTVSAPIIAEVDTNGTLVATPGQGIGVYVEYQAGGHWHVSWTCDTLLTNQSCDFVVDASVDPSAGTIENAAGLAHSGTNSLNEASSRQQIEAVTSTTTGIDEVTFDATPGAIVTVTVQLNAPVSFFFVQNNQVNGGYTGALTNPLLFRPSSP